MILHYFSHSRNKMRLQRDTQRPEAKDFFWLRMRGEKVAQRLGYIWNSPCRQVFSPGCHFHLSSQDCPHLPPACHRFPRSLEQPRRGDDLKPGGTGVRIICVPGNSDRFTPSQSKQPTFYSFLHCSCTLYLLHHLKNASEQESKSLCCKNPEEISLWGDLGNNFTSKPVSGESAKCTLDAERGGCCLVSSAAFEIVLTEYI